MVNISAIAFAVRKQLSAQGISLSIGHTQQLVAAALGHNNLASYQASNDDIGLPEASDIVLDPERLVVRAAELGHDDKMFAHALKTNLTKRFPDSDLYENREDWLMVVQDHFERAIVDDDSVNSEVAMTNGTFPRTDIENFWWVNLDDFERDDLTVEFDGLVTVDQDQDRVYWGHEVEVRATLTVERFGRRMFGRRLIEVEHAKLRWLGEPSELVE